jgi:hypothetical protein
MRLLNLELQNDSQRNEPEASATDEFKKGTEKGVTTH